MHDGEPSLGESHCESDASSSRPVSIVAKMPLIRRGPCAPGRWRASTGVLGAAGEAGAGETAREGSEADAADEAEADEEDAVPPVGAECDARRETSGVARPAGLVVPRPAGRESRDDWREREAGLLKPAGCAAAQASRSMRSMADGDGCLPLRWRR